MTPDEVVKECDKETGYKYHNTLQRITSELQDYQKLREKIDKKKIESYLWGRLPDLQELTKLVAQAIVTYLQQPTEPMEK